MTTTTTRHTHRLTPFAALLLLALAATTLTTTTARALTLGETFFQGGVGIGRLDGAVHKADMTTYTALYNQKILDSFVALDARASYQYGDITSSLGGSIQDSDLDLYLSLPKIPIVKPFAIAGLSYDNFNLNHNFGPEYGWDLGYNLGLGAEIRILPILTLTGIVRYTHSDAERITYALDATVWLSKIGLGANIIYEDGRGSFNNNITQGNLYVAFRF